MKSDLINKTKDYGTHDSRLLYGQSEKIACLCNQGLVSSEEQNKTVDSLIYTKRLLSQTSEIQ